MAGGGWKWLQRFKVVAVGVAVQGGWKWLEWFKVAGSDWKKSTGVENS